MRTLQEFFFPLCSLGAVFGAVLRLQLARWSGYIKNPRKPKFSRGFSGAQEHLNLASGCLSIEDIREVSLRDL